MYLFDSVFQFTVSSLDILQHPSHLFTSLCSVVCSLSFIQFLNGIVIAKCMYAVFYSKLLWFVSDTRWLSKVGILQLVFFCGGFQSWIAAANSDSDLE